MDLTLRTWAWASRQARGVKLLARDEGMLVMRALKVEGKRRLAHN